MNNILWKKSFTIMLSILFIGIAVAPSINLSVVKASQDDDLVEVTTQACGIKGYGNTTVKLTRVQYQNLEQYLVEFRARLNHTTTREEAIPIFKEAVVELEKYELFPRGMSVELVQKLETGGYYNERINRTFQRLFETDDYLIKSNFLCLITGSGNDMLIKGVIPFIQFLIYWWLLNNDIPLSALKYLTLFGRMTFGFSYMDPADWEQIDYPATGWVNTYGLTGFKKWNGSFFGGCGITLPIPIFRDYDYVGAYGFTGIGIITQSNPFFFIGSALWTRIYYA